MLFFLDTNVIKITLNQGSLDLTVLLIQEWIEDESGVPVQWGTGIFT